MKNRMTCLLPALLVGLALGASAQTAYVFDRRGLSWEERCTAEALQGLVNRGGPRLFLSEGNEDDSRWLEIYGKRRGFEYEKVASLQDLLARFGSAARGLVVYDPEVDGSRYVAITLAGIEDLLPVCPAVLKGNELGLEVKRDLRGKFADSMAAYDWALEHAMPRCNRKLAHAVDGRVDGVVAGVCGPLGGFDWPVKHRGFVFNVASEPTKKKSYCPPLVGGSPEQAAMYRRILAALEVPAQITGYGEPEGEWCTLLSEHGHYSFHAYYNWSFHQEVPASRRIQQQKIFLTPRDVEVEPDKYYVCFMTSEGDTMKGPLPFFYGSWFDPYRGKVPVNWGVNPLMGTQFPAMLEYFFDTASANDYFFAGCSGAGYCYPDNMKDLQEFCDLTFIECVSSGIHHVDLWGAARMETLEKYGKWAQPSALTSFAGPARMKLLADGTPVAFHELGYWQSEGLKGEPWYRVFRDDARREAAIELLVSRIESIAARTYPPFVILVYGDLHSYAHHARLYWEVAQKLDPKRFKPARLDEAMSAFRKWSSLRVMIGTESLNERLLWAALEGVPTEVPVTLTNGWPLARSARLEIELAGRVTATDVQLAAYEAKPIGGVELPLAKGDGGKARLRLEAGGVCEVRDIELVTVPCDAKLAKATLAGVWSAPGLRHGTGEAIEDGESLWGRAWSSPAPGGERATLVFGPYASVPKARYLVAFRVRLEEEPAAPGKDPLATLDIYSGGSLGVHEVCARRELKRADFAAPGRWQWFTLVGEWPGDPSLLETRVFWNGRARIAVDRVVAFRVEAGG